MTCVRWLYDNCSESKGKIFGHRNYHFLGETNFLFKWPTFIHYFLPKEIDNYCYEKRYFLS